LQGTGKVFVSCLLILSIALPLLSSNAHGQGISTSTSIVSTNDVFFVSTTTTNTFTINTTFELGPYTFLSCDERAVPFTITKGKQISGSISTNASVQFAVMSNDRYSAWSQKHQCEIAQDYSFYGGTATSGHPLRFNVVASSTGSFWFVFLNMRNSASRVQFQSNVRSLSTLTIAFKTSSEAFRTYYYLISTTLLTRFTTSMTTVPTPPASGQLPVPLVLATIILAVLIALTYRRFQDRRRLRETNRSFEQAF
jgi:hypothetical protein